MKEPGTSGKVRLFVAADVPPGHLDAVDRAAAPMRSKWEQARWVPKPNQHVTLKFIGWINVEQGPEVRQIVAEVAAAHDKAQLSLTGFGCFPGLRRARVLWVGIDDPTAVLGSASRSLDEHLVPVGVPAEERDFVPHLTLARFKRPQGIDDLPGRVDDDPGPFDVEHLTLYRSHLSPKGPRYEAVERFSLGGKT